MKILIDPNMAILIKDLTDAECAEILKCIFEYPSRDCDIGLWKYIKVQIDRDAQKYKEKCDRAANARQKLDLKSSIKSDLISGEKKVVSSNEKYNEIDIEKERESSNANLPVENSVENFLINDFFSFQGIGKIKPAFTNYLKQFLPTVVNRAERTLKQKRTGQHLTMMQIIEWIEQERIFYQQTHKDVK